MQEALLQAYRAFGTLREDAAAARWLQTILVNVFRDGLRKRKPVEESRWRRSRGTRCTGP